MFRCGGSAGDVKKVRRVIIKSMKMFTSSIQGPRPLGLGLVGNGSGDADDDNNDDIVNMRRKRERCSDLPSKAQGRRALA